MLDAGPGMELCRHKYTQGEDWLESSLAEINLRVLDNIRHSMNQWCALAAKRINSILRCIKHDAYNQLFKRGNYPFHIAYCSGFSAD